MPKKPIVRPRDAASLVLYRRRQGGEIEILMGRRHSKHSFMPQRWVFPGGRLDAADSRIRPATPLRPEVEKRMDDCARSPGHARALAVAAIRETFEEVGLLLAKPAPVPSQPVPEDWRGFLDRGLAPALDELDLIMRAITPTFSPKRFHARFFLANAESASGEVGGSGELEDIRWFTIEEAIAIPLVDVTESVVREAERFLAEPDARLATDPVPLFCYRGDVRVMPRR
ncbi:MAG: NUDIX hydrolase [Alphaproteobacteria bacterium]